VTKSQKKPRFTIRLTDELNDELQALGRVEKRRMAEKVRACLKTALSEWSKAHNSSPPVPQGKRATQPVVVIDTSKLVKATQLLEMLFAPDCRPSMRSFKRWQQRRNIPYYKIGHAVFYDPVKVREKLEQKNLIRAI
jgi:hypothetical protein